MTHESSKKRWWHTPRITLRSLMIAVLIVGVVLGWIIHKAHVQRDAVAAIRRAGGSVLYEWEFKDGEPFKGGVPPWPKWLIDRVDVDYLGSVTFAFLPEQGSDAELAHVGRLSRLEKLWIRSPRVTDVGMAHLGRLSCLRELMLAGGDVSDAGVAHLETLSKLRYVSLYNTRVTISGSKALRKKLPGIDLDR